MHNGTKVKCPDSVLLTDGVDVKEANRSSEDGGKHAVMEGLSRFHQHREQDDVPQEPEQDGGCS